MECSADEDLPRGELGLLETRDCTRPKKKQYVYDHEGQKRPLVYHQGSIWVILERSAAKNSIKTGVSTDSPFKFAIRHEY